MLQERVCMYCYVFFLFMQKTASEMRISDWSSDVCSSYPNLSEPRAFRYPCIAANALSQAEVGDGTDKAIARVAPGRRVDMAIEAKARHLVDIWPARNIPIAKIGIEIGKDVRPRRREQRGRRKIGRASCRDRVCQDVEIPVVSVPLKKKHKRSIKHTKS